MLKLVRLNPTKPSVRVVTPALLQPLVRAAEAGEDLVAIVESIVRKLGFDSFLCGWGSAPRPDRDSLLYVFTTLPPAWTALYDRSHFVEVDPRLELAEQSTSIFGWSADELRGQQAKRDQFLDAAASFGIRSGACFGWHDPDGNGVLIAYNSSRPRIVDDELSEIADSLYAFGHAFHELFVRTVIDKDLPSRLRGVALTPREVEALEYAARGLTLQDIGPKMGISPRTVRYHIDSATTKLGALKREEAIALAVKGRLIRVLR